MRGQITEVRHAQEEHATYLLVKVTDDDGLHDALRFNGGLIEMRGDDE